MSLKIQNMTTLVALRKSWITCETKTTTTTMATKATTTMASKATTTTQQKHKKKKIPIKIEISNKN